MEPQAASAPEAGQAQAVLAGRSGAEDTPALGHLERKTLVQGEAALVPLEGRAGTLRATSGEVTSGAPRTRFLGRQFHPFHRLSGHGSALNLNSPKPLATSTARSLELETRGLGGDRERGAKEKPCTQEAALPCELGTSLPLGLSFLMCKCDGTRFPRLSLVCTF